MLFNSLTFIVFFVIVLAVYYGLKNWEMRKTFLLLASYVFYGAWNPPFTIILWISTIIDWYAAEYIYRATDPKKKKLFLLISLVSNLGMLGFFKYGNFVMENVVWLSGFAGNPTQYTPMDIILPVGISFYTFQTLSYTIDVYRGHMKPAQTFIDFALYVTFFPQLVAGPIVRAVDFVPQCVEPKRATSQQIGWGLFLMTLGLFQKVVLADVFLSGTSDSIFAWNKSPLNGFDTWIGLLAFQGQIFFDFAGYSTCAIGASLCLGFLLPDNFRSPFGALGFSDFWTRWHISLSTWLKDYVYIPLGGSRKGKSRALINVFLVMAIGGIWHGASWTFVVWGCIHGVYLMIEQLLKFVFHPMDITKYLPGRVAVRIITFMGVITPSIFFRAKDMSHAGGLFASMFGMRPTGAQILTSIEITTVLLVMFSTIATHWALVDTKFEVAMEKTPGWFITCIWVLMIFALIIAQGGSNAFIYFQF
jgi:alginate O-acetyltransferase complex protein AlgI